MRLGIVILLGAMLPGQAFADDVAQNVGPGQINWTNKTVKATGSGAPSLKAANVAVARLGAERAAKMDAYRNVLEAIKGARLEGKGTAGQSLEASPELKSKVEGVIQGFKVVDTKYYSDGGVEVIIEGPIDGVLADLVPSAGKKAEAGGVAEDGTTGIIVNAKGVPLTPALAPRLLDETGNEIYGASIVSVTAFKKHGAVAYAKSLDQANKDARVGQKPLVVKAARAAEAGSPDLVIAAADAEKIKKVKKVLGEGSVIIVTD